MKLTKLFAVLVLSFVIASPSMAKANDSEDLESQAKVLPYYNRISIGYNGEFLREKYDGVSENMTVSGIAIKYIHGWALSEDFPVYLESGIKGAVGFRKESDYTNLGNNKFKVETSLTTLSVTVPLDVAYRFYFAPERCFQPYTGLTMKMNALAKAKVKVPTANYGTVSETISMFDKKDVEEPWKRFQIGWHIGLALNAKKFFIGIEYGLDFMSLAQDLRTSHLEASIGLNF